MLRAAACRAGARRSAGARAGRPGLYAPAFFLLALACTDRLPGALAGLQERVRASLAAAQPHQSHVWRDVPPLNPDNTANGYIEISRGESTKWEFRIDLNRREGNVTSVTGWGGVEEAMAFLNTTADS